MKTADKNTHAEVMREISLGMIVDHSDTADMVFSDDDNNCHCDECLSKTPPYGYEISHDFRCEQCAEGFDDEDRDKPVTTEPWIGFQCGGCQQYYRDNHQWGSKPK